MLRAEPFVAFRVVLASGTAYEVVDPLQLVPEESKATFYFPRSQRIAIFRLNQIVTIETLEE
jgi:hypothetical protein